MQADDMVGPELTLAQIDGSGRHPVYYMPRMDNWLSQVDTE